MKRPEFRRYTRSESIVVSVSSFENNRVRFQGLGDQEVEEFFQNCLEHKDLSEFAPELKKHGVNGRASYSRYTPWEAQP